MPLTAMPSTPSAGSAISPTPMRPLLSTSAVTTPWAAFDRGECTKDFLVVERFRRFLEAMALDRDPALCNRIHLKALGKVRFFSPHAEEVCRTCPGPTASISSPTPWPLCQRSRLHRSAVSSLYHRRLHLRGGRGQQAQPNLLRLRFRPHPRHHTRELPAHRGFPLQRYPGRQQRRHPLLLVRPPRHRPAGESPHRLPHH